MEELNLELLYKMIEISQRMAETRELKPLLNYAMDEAIKLVGAEQGYLVLLGLDNSLDFQVKRRRDGTDLTEADTQISRSVLDKVIATGEPMILRNTLDHADFKGAQSVIRLQLRSILCVPLISRGLTIGAIYVENRARTGQFTQASLAPLTLFANQTAIAIENAVLNEKLEAKVAARTAELELALAQLEQRWQEAVEFNRIWSILSSTIAHDMRAPLAVIITGLDQLKGRSFGELTPHQATIVTTCLRSVEHVFKLTNDFFDLVKLEMKKLTLHLEVVELEPYLRTLYQVSQAMPWSEGVKFELELEPHLPQVFIDPTRIQQVIVNLLANALKFTQQGQVTLYACRSTGVNTVTIGVRDTGLGIADSCVPSLFERFRQVGDAKARQQGTGLGLAICRELVELHQGKIWVKSRLNIGSDFIFTLPITIP